MKDLISRQAAIDEIDEWIKAFRENVHKESAADARFIRDGIIQLPSAQPQRKTGRWIIKDNPGTGWYRVTCSECGEDVTSTAPCIGFYPNAKVTWDYCPKCGAKMDNETEGQ